MRVNTSRESSATPSARDLYQSAWQALTDGETPEAIAMIRSAHAADPEFPPSARMVAALDRLAEPSPDPDLGSLGSALPGAFRVERGAHVLLLHQHDPVEAATRVELLERVVLSYYLSLAAQGFDLPTPAHRLTSVYFARWGDYRAFLRAEGAGTFLDALGYFHPTRGVVFAPDLSGSARPIGTARALDSSLRDMDLGTAAHETLHQLVAVSGLAPRQDAFPVWLHEGFAAQFEVVRAGRWTGIGSIHPVRLSDYRRLRPPPRLLPLLSDSGFSAEPSPAPYASAWALVYYLRKEHPREFITFLDLLRLPADSPRPLDAFRAAFGADLDSLESDWHRFMRTLRLPDESASPIVEDGESRPSRSNTSSFSSSG